MYDRFEYNGTLTNYPSKTNWYWITHPDNNYTNFDTSFCKAFMAKVIIENGIKESRLSFKGYGETMPIVKNNTAVNKAKNRRTELTIIE